MAARALGTKLMIGANSVVGVKSISGIELTADTIDTTTLDSDGGYKEFIGGFKDAGEVTISGNFEPSDITGQNAMYAAFESGNTIAFQILFPASLGASWSFNGVVTGFSTSAELEDLVSFEATIKVSGKPTLGLTASAGLSGLSLSGTGGTLSPSFANGTYYYTFGGVSANSVTVTATGSSQTIKLYVDGVYAETLSSGSASGAISMAIGSKKLTILANETGKTIKMYEIVVVKTS